MRLPQSRIQSLSVRSVHFLTLGAVLLLIGLLPKSAGASAQQLTCSPSSLKFGTVDKGQSEVLLVTVTNTGETSVTLSSFAVSNRDFTTSSISLPLTLTAGQSVDVNVSFTPAAVGWTSGAITFVSNASNPTLVLQVAGTGVTSEALTLSPSVLSFGSVAIGSHSTLPVVLVNARTWKVSLTAIQTTGSTFSASGATFPLTLNPGQSVTLNVTFSPLSTGEVGGSLLVSGPGVNVPLMGTGTTATGQLTITPATLNFGNVALDTTVTEPMTLTAGGSSVTVYSAATGGSQFVLQGASFPVTISAGQSLSFNVAFTPQGAGINSGSLSFTSNASNTPPAESLTGTGTVTQYSVSISWNASEGVEGYNVYRSTSASGTFLKINSTLDANTAYTDSTVVSGKTYYYEASSVNSSGKESGLSTPAVEATVP